MSSGERIFDDHFKDRVDSGEYLNLVAHLNGYQKTMLEMAKIDIGKKVLDVGNGNGLLVKKLQNIGIKAFGIDLSLNQLSNIPIRDRGNFVNADALIIPFPDKCFEVVVMERSLQWIEDREKALEETLRVLDNEGKVVVAEPRWSGLSIVHPYKDLTDSIVKSDNIDIPHVDTGDLIGELLETNGFRDVVVNVSNDIIPPKLADRVLRLDLMSKRAVDKGDISTRERQRWLDIFNHSQDLIKVILPISIAKGVKS